MTNKTNNKTRTSHCKVCGKRLSMKTAAGAIHWHRGHVDDTGLYCEACHIPKKSGKERGNARP